MAKQGAPLTMSQISPDTTIAVLRTALEASIYALESGAPMLLTVSSVLFYFRADGQFCASRVRVGHNLIVICPGVSSARDIEATPEDHQRSFHHLWRMGARWAVEYASGESGVWEQHGEMMQFDEPAHMAGGTKVICPSCSTAFNTLQSREMHWSFNPECKPTEFTWTSFTNDRGEVIHLPKYVSRKQKEAVAA